MNLKRFSEEEPKNSVENWLAFYVRTRFYESDIYSTRRIYPFGMNFREYVKKILLQFVCAWDVLLKLENFIFNS